MQNARGDEINANPQEIITPVIEVISQTPLLGTGIDIEKVPHVIRVLKSKSISNGADSASLTKAMNLELSSINLGSQYGNALQPDLTFRGFTASPVVGIPQGFAVYQNGIRLNEFFGDTVNWDLIPDFAIDFINVSSANPVFGYNALGGSAAIQMKTGFTFQNSEASVSAGSFGRINASAEYGHAWEKWAYYLGLGHSYDYGWRRASSSRADRFYSDLGFDDGISSFHLDLTWADTSLGGVGPTPDWLLGPDWTAVNTPPGQILNQVFMPSLRSSIELNKTASVQSNIYFRQFHQNLRDGNPSKVGPCVSNAANYCSSNDGGTTFTVPLLDQSGNPVPVSAVAFPNYPAELDIADTTTKTIGGSVQFSSSQPLFSRSHQAVVGLSVDSAETKFNSSAQFGSLNDQRTVIPTPLVVTSTGNILPVGLTSSATYFGFYVTDTIDLSDSSTLTGSARYNKADIKLRDEIGVDLNGDHHYQRLNPSLGGTFKITPQITFFTDYVESNRIPTAAELSCASPTQSCSLSAFFVADPELDQVVARTFEIGVRGKSDHPTNSIGWNLSIFETEIKSDIIQISSPQAGKGYFKNAGDTRRMGLELGAKLKSGQFETFADYSLVLATFQSDLLIYSPNNSNADGNGNIIVTAGKTIPNIPMHRLKLGGYYSVTKNWSIGISEMIVSGQYLHGDESNQTSQTPGYALTGLHSQFKMQSGLEIFGSIDNVLDQRYYSYGTLSTSDGVPPGTHGTGRNYSPGEPFSFLVGLKEQF